MPIIAIEGGDAAGKNTQSKLLATALESKGSRVVQRSFPQYATETGKAILRHLKGQILTVGTVGLQRVPEDGMFFQCAMTLDKLVAAEQMDAFDPDCWIICDRWWQSAYAYGKADGVDPAWLLEINRLVPFARHNFYIHVPAEVAQARRPEARDRYEANREHQAAVVENYKQLWNDTSLHIPGEQWHWIDGTRSIEEVHQQILKIVTEGGV